VLVFKFLMPESILLSRR